VPLDEIRAAAPRGRGIPWIALGVLIVAFFVQLIVNGYLEENPVSIVIRDATMWAVLAVVVWGVVDNRRRAYHLRSAFVDAVQRSGGVRITRSEAARLIYFAEAISSIGDSRSNEPTPEYETRLSREPNTELRLYTAQPAGYEIEVRRETEPA
jgi:hypothetical protein